MHLKDVEVKAYKGYGDLYKFVLEEVRRVALDSCRLQAIKLLQEDNL
jgi:hypothetical protein